MFLSSFYQQEGQQVSVTPEQASRFAKEVAGDFNPIHDPDARRFCVPGDLLFSLILSKYGIHQNMSVTFSGMVGRDVPLVFPNQPDENIVITDTDNKVVVDVACAGEVIHDQHVIEEFARHYVEFSGHNFPHIMVPLMEKHQVMFNPNRPLVIYESMAFELSSVDLKEPKVELASTELTVSGKRGDALFHFDIKDGDRIVGRGDKKLIVSGLMPYDADAIQALVDKFNRLRNALKQSA